MPSISRRTLLRTCAGVAVVGAGCGESPDRDEPPTTRERVRTPAAAETRRLRYDGEPLLRSDREGDDRPRTTFLIATPEERGKLRYRSHPDGWRDLRAFVEETDLSASTLLIVQQRIGECYRRRLVAARRDGDGIDVEFCEQLRPATVPCKRDQQVMEVLAARLPFAVENVSGYSIGGGSECPAWTTEGDR